MMEKELGLNVIIWSKDRPTQLNLCLESLVKNFIDAKSSSIMVVYRPSNERFVKAYDSLRMEWAKKEKQGGPKINFIFDNNFYLMTTVAFGYHEQTMFIVDDQVFYNQFSVKDEVFEIHRKEYTKYFTLSLRLDKSRTYCYPADQNQAIPVFDNTDQKYLSWNWAGKEFDWGYPASLDGNIYHTVPIRSLIARIPPANISNPNTFEMTLNSAAQQGIITYPPKALAYTQAKTISVPANKVQTTFNNRSETEYDIGVLLKIWEEGKKIDVDDAIAQAQKSNSPHFPIKYNFIAR